MAKKTRAKTKQGQQFTQTPPTTGKQKAALTLFGLTLAVLLVLVLELVLALLGWGASTTDPFVGFAGSQSLFEEKDGVFQTRPAKLRFFNEQQFPAKKEQGVRRVFVLGGSTVFGRPYDHRTSFANYLDLLLAKADPSVTYEVINAGGVSYASYRLARLMEELVAYEPDLFIIYTGHNEFLEERTYDDWRFRAGGRLMRLRSARLLRDAVISPQPAPTQMAREVQARLDTSNGLDAFERDPEHDDAVFEHFTFNMERMIKLARDAGAAVLLVTPAANTRDFSPFKSQSGTSLSEQAEKALDRMLDSVAGRLEQGQVENALAELASVPSDPHHARLQYLKGKTFQALGQMAKAKEALLRAREADICALRARAPILASIRELARKRGLMLLDLEQILNTRDKQNGGPGLAGNEAFLDHVHPRIEVHQAVAEEVLSTLMAKGWCTGSVLERSQIRDIYQRLAAGLDPTYQGRRDLNLAKVLGWSGKYAEANEAIERALSVLPEDPTVHFNAAAIAERRNDLEKARFHYARAVALDPDHGPSHFRLGKNLAALGRHEEALHEYATALRLGSPTLAIQYAQALSLLAANQLNELDVILVSMEKDHPDYQAISWLKGEYFRKMGNKTKAEQFYRSHVEQDKNDPGRHYDFAVACFEMALWDKARDGFQQVLLLDAGSIKAMRGLARVSMATGDLEQAGSNLEQAQKIAPDDPEVLADLAAVRQRQGQFENAVTLLQAALKWKPKEAAMANDLGVNLARLGRWREASAAFEVVVDARPNWGRGHYNLAQALAQIGQEREAARHLVEAMDLGQEVAQGLAKKLAPYIKEGQP